VATSERILTTISRPADSRRAFPQPWWSSARRPGWREVLADIATISLGLVLLSAMSGMSAITPLLHYSSLSPVTIALMATTVFATAGAYPRHRTPLDIAATEGLVRGILCGALLLLMGSLNRRSIPNVSTILAIASLSILLVLQREVAYILTNTKPPRQSLMSGGLRPGYSTHGILSIATRDDLVHVERICAQSPSGYVLKRALDVSLASILLALVLPLFLVVAALIKLDSTGPVLIRQRRIGRGGEPFRMWKFRSMYRSVARYERSPVSNSDPRLTNVGRVLRRLSIDEIPQLLNVFEGQMSLVGPRPEMPFIVAKYAAYERQRLNAIPGITGLWQISPARAMPIHDNVELDLFYIENRNVFLDIAILLRTVTAVFRGIGAT
jgi:lipopolysaccharide/colanic/teichoic acid biosynthesis glycosyltransferase